MHASDLFLRLFRFLLPAALIGTVYLYSYPFFQRCDFPEPQHAAPARDFGDDATSARAPFRLLAFGDPQLEGDTSLPEKGHVDLFPSVKRVIQSLKEQGIGSLTTTLSGESRRLWDEDLPKVIKTYRKRLDLWGNDLYLAHIYRTVSWYTDPTHVVVLGDLLGSQWIDDGEFQRRSHRFWNTVFKHSHRVPSSITDQVLDAEILGHDKSWKNRIITVAGNHDIGYAGDVDAHRIERFEDMFGRVNWEVSFALNNTSPSLSQMPMDLDPTPPPKLRLVILNSMNLDEPASDASLHEASCNFLHERLYREPSSKETGTILLTHIPLYKESGICTDMPFFDYFPEHFFNGGIKEQNQLSVGKSALILDGIVGSEQTRSGIILNGHDHAGCDVHHSRERLSVGEARSSRAEPEEEEEKEKEKEKNTQWETRRYQDAAAQIKDTAFTGIREVTVRSMMGDFGGNAGLLSAWWDRETNEWKFDYTHCMAGVQHYWWAIHVLDYVVLGLGAAGVLATLVSGQNRQVTTAEKKLQ